MTNFANVFEKCEQVCQLDWGYISHLENARSHLFYQERKSRKSNDLKSDTGVMIIKAVVQSFESVFWC